MAVGHSPRPSARCSSCGLAGSSCAGIPLEHQPGWLGACPPRGARGTAPSWSGHGRWLSHGAPRPGGRPAAGKPGAAPQPDAAAPGRGPAQPKHMWKGILDIEKQQIEFHCSLPYFVSFVCKQLFLESVSLGDAGPQPLQLLLELSNGHLPVQLHRLQHLKLCAQFGVLQLCAAQMSLDESHRLNKRVDRHDRPLEPGILHLIEIPLIFLVF